MSLIFTALPTAVVAPLRAGAPDAYGQPPERHVSDGSGNPCGHCLRDIEAGAGMLVLAFCPFPKPQPYAETGPIFLCAADCDRHQDSARLPAMLAGRPRMLVKGYGSDDRIVYGTGAVIAGDAIEVACRGMFDDARVGYIHLRSAANNCYQARVDRA